MSMFRPAIDFSAVPFGRSNIHPASTLTPEAAMPTKLAVNDPRAQAQKRCDEARVDHLFASNAVEDAWQAWVNAGHGFRAEARAAYRAATEREDAACRAYEQAALALRPYRAAA